MTVRSVELDCELIHDVLARLDGILATVETALSLATSKRALRLLALSIRASNQ
jgi:hypothetical protein